MSDLNEGDPVAIAGLCPTGRVVRVYGKGTKLDPECVTVEIPAQVLTVRRTGLIKLEPKNA